MTEPHFLGDKRCPKCHKNMVKWISAFSTTIPTVPNFIEVGYYQCDGCGWTSEPHITEISRIDDP